MGAAGRAPRPAHRATRNAHSAPRSVATKRANLLQLDSWALDRPDTGTPWDANASMIWRRLKVYHFKKRVPKPPTTLKACPRCFAELLLTSSTSGSSAGSASSEFRSGAVYL